jgi:hypothetical protein
LLGVSRPAVTQYKEILPPKRIARLRELHPEWFTDEPPTTEIDLQPAEILPA